MLTSAFDPNRPLDMGRFVLAALMLTLSTWSAAGDRCPVEVRVHATPESAGLDIDGTGCKASVEQFWRVVEDGLPHPLPQNLAWFSLMAPAGADQVAAMSRAWGRSCNSPGRPWASFLEAYKRDPAFRVLAPSLARLTPVPHSVDNFYVVRRLKGSISNSACDGDLMTPVIYYRLSPAKRRTSAPER